MQIKELELENFKSFRHRKFVFGGGITAVVGPNGAGKSNIFDALLFVLGNNSSAKLRYKKISDLICKNQKERYAIVRLTFSDNTTIERTVTEDVSVFRLNGKRTTQESITSFLKELKINPEGHNMVLQGNNKKIVNMTMYERKALIENIADVSFFDEQRQKSENNLEFVVKKIDSAKTVMDERKVVLENLKKEKSVAEKYLKIKKDKVILKGVILKKEKNILEIDLRKIKKKIEKLEETIPKNKSKITSIRKELNNIVDKLNLEKEKLKKQSDLYSDLNNDYNLLAYKISEAKKQVNDLIQLKYVKNKKIETLKSTKKVVNFEDLKNIETKLNKLKRELDKQDINDLKKQQKVVEDELKKIDFDLSKKYVDYYEMKTKLSQKKQYDLREKKRKEKLEEIEKLKSSIKSKISTLKSESLKISNLKKQMDNLHKEIDNLNVSILNIQKNISNKDYEIEYCKKEISILKDIRKTNTDIIPIGDKSDIDAFIEKATENNMFGTFYFVYKQNYENVKEKIIVKNVNPNSKIGYLRTKINSLENEKENLKSILEEKNFKLSNTLKKLENTKTVYSNLQKEFYEKKSVNNNLQNQIQLLEEQRKELQSEKEFIVDFSQERFQKIEQQIMNLKEKKLKLPKVDFDSYFSLLNEYRALQDEYNIRKAKLKEEEIKVELDRKEILNLENDVKEISLKIKNKNTLINRLEVDFKEFGKKKYKSEKELRIFEKKVYDFEQKIKDLDREKLHLETKVGLQEQERQNNNNIVFLKEEDLKKKNSEIKKYIEMNRDLNPLDLQDFFDKNKGVSIKVLQDRYYGFLNDLNDFGNVNLKSIEDYDGYLRKYDAIKNRINQLYSESEKIKEKLTEIQQEKEKKFMSVFNQINSNFVKILGKLGLKNIELEVIRNELKEIVGVTIRGKKKSTISLSGGEKTLITISFLFSVLALEPAGFYFLDEIDADLDYNKSEKVFNMLNDFAKSTQIFLITHNPVIINKSENVIGVSKSSSGVTTIFLKQEKKQYENQEM